ncbi:hypothetical protein BV210_04700 [Halorientalis sp. IM1011]|uniref:hypothetical protein n=1 Tax=Halorientalis sp. IM1011 TaxID=1932360 RepID=UPI00097CD640|nr:hypothetical protein [Halorientalis sp. IM1011]AQL42057.1 hypothetical protein BV210_04700 [Halorientalis sp. IM1011]
MGTLLRLKEYLSSDQPDRYECLACSATFERQPQVCPNCGGYDIRSKEWLDSGGRPPEKRP